MRWFWVVIDRTSSVAKVERGLQVAACAAGTIGYTGIMPYDASLAERIRKELDGHENVSERKMFGGLAAC